MAMLFVGIPLPDPKPPTRSRRLSEGAEALKRSLTESEVTPLDALELYVALHEKRSSVLQDCLNQFPQRKADRSV